MMAEDERRVFQLLWGILCRNNKVRKAASRCRALLKENYIKRFGNCLTFCAGPTLVPPYSPLTHRRPQTHNIHQVIITSLRSWPVYSNHHTSASSCTNTVLYTSPQLPLTLEKKKSHQLHNVSPGTSSWIEICRDPTWRQETATGSVDALRLLECHFKLFI